MDENPKRKVAVVLQNLGGPDSLAAVEPFLYQLFSDKAIISLPQPFRWLLATYISKKRRHEAQEIYQQLGGKSPILAETTAQALQLEAALNRSSTEGEHYAVFIAMRYWHPFTEECIDAVRDYKPDEVILLPLYPQYSTTTTASSYDRWISLWNKSVDKSGDRISVKAVCCYHTHPDFIAAHVDVIQTHLSRIPAQQLPHLRLLFSAHGLPQSVIDKGDPYAMQVKQSVTAIVEKLKIPSLDYTICYQSKVGRLKWLEPATDHEIIRGATEGKYLLIVPIAFVSEHSETLVELDIQYKQLAKEHKAVGYDRVAALGVHPQFINALCQVSQMAVSHCVSIQSGACDKCALNGGYLCGKKDTNDT